MTKQKVINRRILPGILIILMLAMITAIVFIVSSANDEPFTEFYILDQYGKAGNYPRQMALGDEANLILGIVNHEHQETSYRVAATIDEAIYSETGPVTIAPGEVWEKEVEIIPARAGAKQLIEFLLYKEDNPEQYLYALELWIDVTD
ncbi:MAG: DUF1616 domain-containing protein [bacterium]|nr:DUF1616 domain-containing protein [bacterium]